LFHKSLLFLLFLSNIAFADVIYTVLDEYDSKGQQFVDLQIINEIDRKDYEDFKKAVIDINKNSYRVKHDSVILNSKGGDIYPAMFIGYLIRKNHLSTWVFPDNQCLSACTYILIAGVCRMAEGDVGLHRSRTDMVMDPLETHKDVLTNKDYEKKFYKEMDTPYAMLELQQSIEPWDMYYLFPWDKKKFGLYYATESESRYRLEIAARKRGVFKEVLYDKLKEQYHEMNDVDVVNYEKLIWTFPSCNEQLYLDDDDIEFAFYEEEPLFEIDETNQGYYKNDEFIATSVIPSKPGTIHGWYISFFTKGKEVEIKERVTMSGPTNWTGVDDSAVISDDTKTIEITHKIENNGSMTRTWETTEDDPKGPFFIELFHNDTLIKRFDYELE
jgi:hypothetical protein